MDWQSLFERADTECEVTVEEIREAVAARRER